MADRRGMTLLEVLVAMVMLATGVVALQRLIVGSVAGIADDVRLTRAMVLAQALLAEAELAPPEPGHMMGDLDARPGGAALHFERDVTRTPHDGLREVRVRVFREADGRDACELVELVRVPTT